MIKFDSVHFSQEKELKKQKALLQKEQVCVVVIACRVYFILVFVEICIYN